MRSLTRGIEVGTNSNYNNLVKLLKLIAINLTLFILLIVAAEGFFTLIRKKDPDLPTLSWVEAFKLALNYQPHLQTYGEKYHPGLFIAPGIMAHFNSDLSRSIPQKVKDPDTRVLFLGGSFTFGSGVKDHETMPAQWMELAPKSQAINMGIPGMGPSEAVHFLKTIPLKEGKHKKDIAVFTLIPDHFNRVSLGWSHLWWSDPTMIIKFKQEGEKLLGGGFLPEEDYPLFLMSIFLKTSETVQFIASQIPRQKAQERFSLAQKKLTFRVLKKLEEILKERLPQAQFYLFVLGPKVDGVNELAKEFNLTLLNPERAFSSPHILEDLHFNPTGNRELAFAIKEGLKKQGVQLDDEPLVELK